MNADFFREIESQHKAPSVTDFEQIYRSEYSYVLHTLKRMGARPSDVEDLVQEVFVAAHRNHAQYDKSRPIKPWLFGFAYRTVANHRRLFRVRYEDALSGEGENLELQSSGASPQTNLERTRTREDLLQALSELSHLESSVIALHDLDGFTAREVAAALQVGENEVESKLKTARTYLRRRLRAHHPNPPLPTSVGAQS